MSKKLTDEEVAYLAREVAVFNRHEDKRFDDEWGWGGVTISCGPRSWIVHIPCDPDFRGTVFPTMVCNVCQTEVPEHIKRRFDLVVEASRPSRGWIAGDDEDLPG